MYSSAIKKKFLSNLQLIEKVKIYFEIIKMIEYYLFFYQGIFIFYEIHYKQNKNLGLPHCCGFRAKILVVEGYRGGFCEKL